MSVQVVSFNCVLKNLAGTVISSTFNREVITTVEGQPGILAGLARGMQNLKKGEKRKISLSAQEAYGFYEPSKVILVPRKNLGKDVRVGEMVSIVSKSGLIRTYKVIEIHRHMVTLDGNHPLAGQDLVFEIEAVEAREATAEEIAESANMMSHQHLH